MPILDLQKRVRELGRIRIGQVVPSNNGGRARPTKLDRFRITSASRELLDTIAGLYGGEVREWTPQGSQLQQWEVLTTSTRLPVLVPPQPVTQWYETWSGGGCQRRCDGVREVLKDQACPCGPDPEQRVCKPTTRLNVVLREVEGIGVFRLESHGYNAAVELPMAAELLARAGGYIEGYLTLEERRVVRDGETKRFMVPALDIGMTPGQLLAGGGTAGQLGAGQQPAVDAPQQRAALPAGSGDSPPPEPETQPASRQSNGADVKLDVDSVRAAIAAAPDRAALGQMWDEIKQAGLVKEATARGKELQNGGGQQQRQDPPREQRVDSAGTSAGDADAAWSEVMRAVPEDWTTTDVEQDFELFAETKVEEGTAQQMREYLVALPQRTKASA